MGIAVVAMAYVCCPRPLQAGKGVHVMILIYFYIIYQIKIYWSLYTGGDTLATRGVH